MLATFSAPLLESTETGNSKMLEVKQVRQKASLAELALSSGAKVKTRKYMASGGKIM